MLTRLGWVIPAAVTIDPETQNGKLDVVLKSGWKLISSNGLCIRIKGFANEISTTVDDKAAFTLKSSEGKSVKYGINYKNSSGNIITLTGKDYASYFYKYNVVNLIDVNKASSNTADIKNSLNLYVPTLPTDPGVYTDTITFGITLY